MKALKFSTSICCEGCIRQLAHFFSDTQIRHWHVDLNHPLNVLTVEQVDVAEEEVIRIVRKAGFDIEQIKWFYNGELLSYPSSMN